MLGRHVWLCWFFGHFLILNRYTLIQNENNVLCSPTENIWRLYVFGFSPIVVLPSVVTLQVYRTKRRKCFWGEIKSSLVSKKAVKLKCEVIFSVPSHPWPGFLSSFMLQLSSLVFEFLFVHWHGFTYLLRMSRHLFAFNWFKENHNKVSLLPCR